MACSSSSSHSAAASYSRSCKYDVFLSFRGEDTRKTFVDHLYTALIQHQIRVYKDNETLPRGESIDQSLFEAIEESRIAVIVFSRNYADSSWCLEELAHIMKCKDERELTVIPIFYDVEPTEVRNLKRKFGEAFSKQEAKNTTKAEIWRKALLDVSNIAGWEPKNIADGHESQFIKKVVDTILDRLFPLNSCVDEDLVGLRARFQILESLLDIGSDGVRMVGIWGVGGGGKTTLATSVYMGISQHFQGHCIVENVREETRKYGLIKLQQNILSALFQKKVEVHSVVEGKCMMKRLPLAIKVLGSFLYDKNKKEWISALDKLKDIPDLEVMKVLKISYDGLDANQKTLFLDIACFWRFHWVDNAIEILEACGYHPEIGIKVLRQKGLLTVVDGRFDMHDLVQEMGHYIVRGKHPNNPESHSRVWKHEDIKEMCFGDERMENNNIEAMLYEEPLLDHDYSLPLCNVVSKMKKLRLLSVSAKGKHEDEGPNFLSNELRYIDWKWYPARSPFPNGFLPMKLVVLKLGGSMQKELWKGDQPLATYSAQSPRPVILLTTS